jgi:hypothetical protein
MAGLGVGGRSERLQVGSSSADQAAISLPRLTIRGKEYGGFFGGTHLTNDESRRLRPGFGQTFAGVSGRSSVEWRPLIWENADGPWIPVFCHIR